MRSPRLRATRRALLAAAALGLGGSALVGVACRGALGVDETNDVTEKFCFCADTFDPDRKIFRSAADCEVIVTDRLGGVSDEARAAWLAKYVDHCGTECANAADCYYTVPVCSMGVCVNDAECCSHDAGVDACKEGYCLPVLP